MSSEHPAGASPAANAAAGLNQVAAALAAALEAGPGPARRDAPLRVGRILEAEVEEEEVIEDAVEGEQQCGTE